MIERDSELPKHSNYNAIEALSAPRLKKMSLSRKNILNFASIYDKTYIGKKEQIIEQELRDWFSEHRYLDKETFIKLGMWKSPRPKKYYLDANNTNSRIKKITSEAISSTDEFFKVMSLQTISGVGWPVASVILHYAHPDKYTILDFRALDSLGIAQPSSYNYDFWQNYTNKVVNVSKKFDVSLRTLDKALWMYSKLYNSFS